MSFISPSERKATFSPYFQKYPILTHDDILSPKTSVSYFTSTQLSAIYNFPSPNLNTKTVVGVISFGGGLVGTVSSSGVLTGGDIQAHWRYLGISPANFPQVILVLLGGATNSPNPNDGATIENTIDIETIGAMYPSSNLTIILYIAPNTLNGFTTLLNAVATPITVNGQVYKPSVVSCSWGAPELYFSSTQLNNANSQLQSLSAGGVLVTAATGDNGSSDGAPGNNADFPSSSPYVLACGGTTLVCPNRVYDGQTVETAWSSGGGGISKFFAKPAYQSALSGTGRNTPDIALVADPNTGVVYTVGGIQEIIGGTSIVSPAMAAFAALINAKLFFVPSLYSYPSSAYHDITVGNNGGFSSKINFDNCTGLGSIKGTMLAASILGPTIPVTGVALSPPTFTATVGSTYQLTAAVSPTNATNSAVTFASSNTAVATVNGTGLVTPVAAGTVTITVTTVSGNFTATSVGTVPTVVPVSVTVSPSTVNLNVTKTTQLSATVLPASVTNKSVTWLSSNSSVATVNSLGVVTGIANGTVIITCTANGSIRGTCTVTVLTPVTGVSVSPTTVSINVGANTQITATVQPATASNKTVAWQSGNTTIATVNSSGVIHGVKKGTTTVLVVASAYSNTVRVTVT
jgi:hypothetical protein